MTSVLYFEDVNEQMPIPVVSKETSSRLSAMWAAASGDFDPIHYDKDFALAQKLPDIIVNGRLKIALLGQLMTTFMGPRGRLKRLAARHQAMDIVGKPLSCKGQVTRKYRVRGENLVDCEIWVESPEGEKSSTGSATIALPSRKEDPS
jgi:acyl dehydratase